MLYQGEMPAVLAGQSLPSYLEEGSHSREFAESVQAEIREAQQVSPGS